jgi:hypothetical protein
MAFLQARARMTLQFETRSGGHELEKKKLSRIKMRMRIFSATPIGAITVYNNRHLFTMLSSVISITFDIRSLFSEKCS